MLRFSLKILVTTLVLFVAAGPAAATTVDIAALQAAFGAERGDANYDASVDFDGNGLVDGHDFAALVALANGSAPGLLTADGGGAGPPEVTMTLTQTGGTYDPMVGAVDGDTLELTISASVLQGFVIILLDAGIVWAGGTTGGVKSFDGGVETAFFFDPNIVSAPLVPIRSNEDIKQVIPLAASDPGAVGQADGWELANITGSTALQNFSVDLGRADFTLDGTDGTILIGAVGDNFGSVVTTTGGMVVTDQQSLGDFVILPEPDSALAACAVVGALALVRRRGRRAASWI